MSGQATGWVLRHGPHPEHLDRNGRKYGARARGLRAVLHTVADAANADGANAHPGIEGVARGSLYSRRQAINLLDELEAEGWLEVTAQGGGRALATVYRLPMVERGKGAVAATETVQPAAVKGATGVPETVQSPPETVQPGVHPNGMATDSSNAQGNAQALPGLDPPPSPPQPVAKPVDPMLALANRLARAEWERRDAKPVCGFVAMRARIQEALEAGWPEQEVAAVLPQLPAWSRNAMDLALSQARQRRRGPASQSRVDQDRGTAGGEVRL